MSYSNIRYGGTYLSENFIDKVGDPLKEGYISLQSEGHPIEFKNIRIKELDQYYKIFPQSPPVYISIIDHKVNKLIITVKINVQKIQNNFFLNKQKKHATKKEGALRIKTNIKESKIIYDSKSKL